MLIPRVSRFGIALLAALAAPGAQAANLVVTTTADSGAGSLREAITTANGNGEADTITFAPALADQTIAPTTPLPPLAAPQITLDGDLDDDCAPDINLSGASVGASLQAGIAITNLGSGAVVRGLALHSFPRAAVSLGATGGGVVLTCNWVGTDTLGIAVLPNGSANLEQISVGTSGNTIGPGNLVANGRGVGLRVSEGSVAVPNGFDFTGPPDSAPRVYANLSFNDNCGAFVGDGFTPTDGSGRPYTDQFGMRLRGRLTVGASGTYDFAFAGLDDQARLVIDGVQVGAPLGGMDLQRSASLGAGAHTIEIGYREFAGAARLTPAITGPGSIALTSDDQPACAPPAAPGLCAELFQLRAPSTGNRITRNRFRDNAGAGISLSLCLLANDPGDADIGANELLNSPTVTGVAASAGSELLVTGTAPANSTVELFQAAPDPSGFGEGATFLGQATASAGGNFALSVPAAPSGALTATATDAAGNTSEFGRNLAYSTGASGLYARALSSAAIELTWRDPELVETGFRIERSIDGTTFVPAGTVGADATTHVDGSLAANTLYHYRVVATTAAGDAPASNRATASTFPLAAAKVCFDRFPRNVDFANGVSFAFDGTHWGAIYGERRLGEDNLDLVFRRYDPVTLAGFGSAVKLSDSDMNVGGAPRLVWNGQRYGALWLEPMRGPAGTLATGRNVFATFERDGSIVRSDVRTPLVQLVTSIPELVWDGTHWGVFTSIAPDPATSALADVAFARLTATGSPVGGLVYLTATTGLNDAFVAADFSPSRGHYGIAWVRGRDNAWDLVFQRFSPGGTAIDPQPVVLETYAFALGDFGLGNVDVLWDGTNWAVAYSRDDPTHTDSAVFLRRVDGTTGVPIGVAGTRLSDDAADASNVAALRRRPDGGYVVFTQTAGLNFTNEIARVQATPAGARDGTRMSVTPNDNQANFFNSVESNGSEFLLGMSAQATFPGEVAALRVAADGSAPPGAPFALTSGHTDPDGVPRNPLHVATLSDGFVAAWADGPANASPRVNARIYNGAGQAVSTLTPISAGTTRGILALASVGNTFALAWKSSAPGGGDLVFARYNASGGPITGERTIATATGAGANVALGWDGENYALFWAAAGGSRFQRVRPDGTALGSAVVLPRGPDGLAQIAWLGDSWVLLTRAGNAAGDIDFLRIDAQGTVLAGPTTLTTNTGRPPGNQRMAYNGRELGAIWSAWSGLDPPAEDIVFTVLNRDGTKAFPETPVVASQLSDLQARLYVAGANFRIVTNGGGFGSGLREVEVTPAGQLVGSPRFVSNRPSAVGSAAVASNGATQGLFYFPSDSAGLHFHTNACLADATPPPCPALAARVFDGAVEATWAPVADPESGVIRYHLYRDGTMLAELDADVAIHRDRGFERGASHVYSLRALNGAFRDSTGCPSLALDTDAIFADGYE